MFGRKSVGIIVPSRPNLQLLTSLYSNLLQSVCPYDTTLCVVLMRDDMSEDDLEKQQSAVYMTLDDEYTKLAEGEKVKSTVNVLCVFKKAPFHIAHARNFGAKALADHEEYVAFVDDDVVLMEGVLPSMLDFLEHYPFTAGSVSPILIGKSGGIQSAGYVAETYEDGSHGLILRGRGKSNANELAQTTSVMACCGSCMAMAYEIFENLGGFRDMYSYALEDIDLGLRLQTVGYRNYVLGHLKTLHYEAQTRPLRQEEETIVREQEALLWPSLDIFESQCKKGIDGLTEVDRRMNTSEWSLKKSITLQTEFPERDKIILDFSDAGDMGRVQEFYDRYGLSDTDNKLHVLCVSHGGGCGRYRVENPAKYVNRLSDSVRMFPTEYLIPELLAWAHSVVWHINMPETMAYIRDLFCVLGIPQIADSDDNCLHVDSLNPSGGQIHRDVIKQWLKRCGRVTVSRAALARAYKEDIPSICPAVLPNYIDFETVPEPKYNEGSSVRIGWYGGASHYRDLLMFAPVAARLKQEFGDAITFCVLGWDGRMPEEFGVRAAWGDMEIEHTAGVDIDKYYQAIADQRMDIAVAPLADTVFNKTGKSPVKYLEGAAMHVPMVLQRMSVYEEAAIADKTALFASTAEEWYVQLRKLILDRTLRRQLGDAAHAHVRAEFDIKDHWYKWEQLYIRDSLPKHGLVREPMAYYNG